MISFLQNPNENVAFSERLAILSATDFIHYAIDCLSNSRGRVGHQDACNQIITKAPGIVEYLKGILPYTISVAGMSPTQVFVAFAGWVNSTVKQ